jgi:hypothetical protein
VVKNLKSAYQRYLDRFRKPATTEVPKVHLGETLVGELGNAVLQRLNQIMPFFISNKVKDACVIRTSHTSFWEKPRKYIVLTIFLEFDENIQWKDEH